MDGLARSTPERIVREGSREARGTDSGELISRIPTIRRRPAGIGDSLEIAVEVVGQGVRSKRRLLIVDVVARSSESGRNRTPREGPSLLDPIPCGIIGVSEIADDGRALLIRETEQLGGRIVRIDDAISVRQRQTGSSVSIVVADSHEIRSLRNLDQPVGVVIGVAHRRLTLTIGGE